MALSKRKYSRLLFVCKVLSCWNENYIAQCVVCRCKKNLLIHHCTFCISSLYSRVLPVLWNLICCHFSVAVATAGVCCLVRWLSELSLENLLLFAVKMTMLNLPESLCASWVKQKSPKPECESLRGNVEVGDKVGPGQRRLKSVILTASDKWIQSFEGIQSFVSLLLTTDNSCSMQLWQLYFLLQVISSVPVAVHVCTPLLCTAWTEGTLYIGLV